MKFENNGYFIITPRFQCPNPFKTHEKINHPMGSISVIKSIKIAISIKLIEAAPIQQPSKFFEHMVKPMDIFQICSIEKYI